MQWSRLNEISLRNNLIGNRILPETRRAARRVRQSRPSSRRDAFGYDELRPSPGLSRQPQARREAEEDTLSALAHHLPFNLDSAVERVLFNAETQRRRERAFLCFLRVIFIFATPYKRHPIGEDSLCQKNSCIFHFHTELHFLSALLCISATLR